MATCVHIKERVVQYLICLLMEFVNSTSRSVLAVTNTAVQNKTEHLSSKSSLRKAGRLAFCKRGVRHVTSSAPQTWWAAYHVQGSGYNTASLCVVFENWLGTLASAPKGLALCSDPLQPYFQCGT